LLLSVQLSIIALSMSVGLLIMFIDIYAITSIVASPKIDLVIFGANLVVFFFAIIVILIIISITAIIIRHLLTHHSIKRPSCCHHTSSK